MLNILPKTITKTLSFRLSLMVAGEIALLLLLSLIAMFYFSRKTIKQEAMLDAEQTLEGTVQHIDNILLSVEQSTGNIYWDIIAHLDQPDRLEAYCKRLLECNPYIVSCTFAFKPFFYPDREFCMIHAHRQATESGEDIEVVDRTDSHDYTEQAWYTGPMTSKRAGWTEPQKDNDTTSEATTSFCLPLYDKKWEVVGVLAVDLPIALLSQIVLSAKPSPHGYSTLLGRNGTFIVHPDTVKLRHQTVFTQTKQGAHESVLEAAQAMVNGEKGVKAFLLNNEEWYVFYKPFKRAEVPGRAMEQLSWSVGVVYPEDDIFGAYNRLMNNVIICSLTALVLFFFLCRLITHRQLVPLRLLTRSAQSIAQGNYNEIIPDSHRTDEIGRLQDNFQLMQQALATRVSEFEQMTATLHERSEQLRDTYSRSQEANRTKTAFLHNMTNQMIAPSEAIIKHVNLLTDNYSTISQQDAEREESFINEESQTIIELLNKMIISAEDNTNQSDQPSDTNQSDQPSDDSTGKEVDHAG